MSDLHDLFKTRFPEGGGAPMRVSSPYRVCPLGAHVDHQHGLISGFAIDKGVELAFRPADTGDVTLYSSDFPGRVCFSVQDEALPRLGDWGDFARGSAWALSRRKRIRRGLCGVVRGSLPVGGLSSSAAVILCYLQALLRVNDLRMDADGLIGAALEAEKDFVGVNVGALDPSCEVYSRRGRLLFLDTRDRQYELIPAPSSMPAFDVMIFYSGLSRKLGDDFNARVDELKAASWYLKALAGESLGLFQDTRLRDVPSDVFARFERRLPEPFRRRARHFYTECDRVRLGAEKWRQGDLPGFGRLIFESGQSSIENYEAGSAHLITLYQALTGAPGVYGARFSGAGFKGCCVALVNPARRAACVQFVTGLYLDRYPELRDSFSVHVCCMADGLGVNLG